MSLAEQPAAVTDGSAVSVDRRATAATFDSTDPAGGAAVGALPVHDAAVPETVDRAAGRPRRTDAVQAPRQAAGQLLVVNANVLPILTGERAADLGLGRTTATQAPVPA